MTPTRPRLARLAASTGNDGRIPLNVLLASPAAPGAVTKRARSLRIRLAQFGGEPGQPVGQGPDVVAAANLGFQERAHLVDQLARFRPVGVRLVDEQSRRLDQPRQLRPGPVERLERFAQQILQAGVADAADQRVGLLQQPFDVLADGGPALVDA